MKRMTKAERKNHALIDRWLAGEVEVEVELDTDFVLKNYIPTYDPFPMGEFYTSPKMADHALSLLFYTQGSLVLDPCAGIGAMSRFFADAHSDWQYQLDTYELSHDAYRVYERLYPDVNSTYGDAFDHWDKFVGQYNYVVMNPPFGAVSGMETAEEVCVSGATRSEHCFLELATRAIAPGGHIIAIAPPSLMDSLPEKAKRWFNDRLFVEYQSQLEGKFKQTGIVVDVFVIYRQNDPQTMWQLNLLEEEA